MAPTLLQVEEEYKDKVNFVMINGDTREAWPLIEAFGVDAIPHLAMVSSDGDVETALIGPIPKQILEADLDGMYTAMFNFRLIQPVSFSHAKNTPIVYRSTHIKRKTRGRGHTATYPLHNARCLCEQSRGSKSTL